MQIVCMQIMYLCKLCMCTNYMFMKIMYLCKLCVYANYVFIYKLCVYANLQIYANYA